MKKMSVKLGQLQTIKARQFNTILNRSIEAEEQASINKDAAEYRKESDGE